VKGPCIRRAARCRSFTYVKYRAVALSFGSPCDHHILITVAGERACTLPVPSRITRKKTWICWPAGRRPAGEKDAGSCLPECETSDICLSAAEEQGHGNPGHVIWGGTPFFLIQGSPEARCTIDSRTLGNCTVAFYTTTEWTKKLQVRQVCQRSLQV